MSLTSSPQLDLSTPEAIREQTACPRGPHKCELRAPVANMGVQCAIGAMQVDIIMKMNHAMQVHGLVKSDAVAFVVGCYVESNRDNFDREGLVALGVLVGELACRSM
jgi:hypothetical protein